MARGGSACGGETTPVTVVESKEKPEGEAIRSKKVRDICDIESAPTVLGPVKEMLSVNVERCGGRERENWLLWTRRVGRKDRRREGSMKIRWW